MLLSFFYCICLSAIFAKELQENAFMSQSYENSLKAIKENTKIQKEEKFFVELLLKQLYQTYHKNMIVKLQVEKQKKEELEKDIYRKYLASRNNNSSILRDFHTLRY